MLVKGKTEVEIAGGMKVHAQALVIVSASFKIENIKDVEFSHLLFDR